MIQAGAGGQRSVVAATAEEFRFTNCFGQTFSLFPPVPRWLLQRSVALQQPAARRRIDDTHKKKRLSRFPQPSKSLQSESGSLSLEPYRTH